MSIGNSPNEAHFWLQRRNAEIIDALREHSDKLVHANTRSEAVHWMARADDLMRRAAKALENRR